MAWFCWSNLFFRFHRTFKNYLGYVRLGCELVAVPAGAVSHPSVKRATAVIQKRSAFAPRERHFIQLPFLLRLMELARGEDCEEEAMCYLATYAFLLRLPSERLRFSLCPRRQLIF